MIIWKTKRNSKWNKNVIIINKTFGRNWDWTTGVVHRRKQSRLDCIDPLSKIIALERDKKDKQIGKEEGRGSFQFLSQPWNRGNPDERKQKGREERERKLRETVGIAIFLFFQKEMKEDWNANRSHKDSYFLTLWTPDFPQNSIFLPIYLFFSLSSFLNLSAYRQWPCRQCCKFNAIPSTGDCKVLQILS